MAERLPFFTLFESFQAPRQLRLLLHDAYVTGGALDREARTIEVQAVSSETVPEAAVTSLEHMLAQQYDLRRVQLRFSAPAALRQGDQGPRGAGGGAESEDGLRCGGGPRVRHGVL